jgi:hypothetical protein
MIGGGGESDLPTCCSQNRAEILHGSWEEGGKERLERATSDKVPSNVEEML